MFRISRKATCNAKQAHVDLKSGDAIANVVDWIISLTKDCTGMLKELPMFPQKTSQCTLTFHITVAEEHYAQRPTRSRRV